MARTCRGDESAARRHGGVRVGHVVGIDGAEELALDVPHVDGRVRVRRHDEATAQRDPNVDDFFLVFRCLQACDQYAMISEFHLSLQ